MLGVLVACMVATSAYAAAAVPDTVQVKVFQNGIELPDSPYTLKAADNWYLAIDNLPKKDGGGNPYTYTVEEVPVSGYNA